MISLFERLAVVKNVGKDNRFDVLAPRRPSVRYVAVRGRRRTVILAQDAANNDNGKTLSTAAVPDRSRPRQGDRQRRDVLPDHAPAHAHHADHAAGNAGGGKMIHRFHRYTDLNALFNL